MSILYLTKCPKAQWTRSLTREDKVASLHTQNTQTSRAHLPDVPLPGPRFLHDAIAASQSVAGEKLCKAIGQLASTPWPLIGVSTEIVSHLVRKVPLGPIHHRVHGPLFDLVPYNSVVNCVIKPHLIDGNVNGQIAIMLQVPDIGNAPLKFRVLRLHLLNDDIGESKRKLISISKIGKIGC